MEITPAVVAANLWLRLAAGLNQFARHWLSVTLSMCLASVLTRGDLRRVQKNITVAVM
jgi:hypothetical protein